MECCISICSSPVGKVGELLVQHVNGRLEFIFFYKKHLDNLKESNSRLEDAESRLELSVQKALRNLEEIHDDVQHWQKKVHEIIQEAKRLVEQAEAQGDARCGHGLFPNLKLRNRLGKEAYKCELEVKKMLDTAPNSESVSYQPERQCHVENDGYESFESRRKIMDQIRDALVNDDDDIIGVYGMAGIGKTMLVKEVARKALEDNLFNVVVITTVSEKLDYRRIQQEIAYQLNLSFGDKTEISERKDLLRKKLELRKEEAENKPATKKKILIVLDDIWEKFDLDVVGISFKSGRARCKVILTSRYEDVIHDDMDVARYFPVCFLSDAEATTLFNKIVRGKAEHPDFMDLAKSIVEQCACLPIVIDTVASALKNKSVYEWKDALRQLQDSVLTDIKGMEERVFKSIKMSYDFLKSEEAQSLLLFCCLYEEDADIDVYHLLMYGLGWGLFKEVHKVEDAKCRIRSLIDKLKDHCLLLKGDHEWSVKVHDVVRDFGIHFARGNKQMYNIRSDEEMDKWLDDEKKPKNSAAISLQYDSIKSLPQRLECPKLQLFWAWNDTTLQLQDLFFKESKELKVLDLSSLSLRQPPSSLRYLHNLQTLRLSGCKLESVAWIGELKNLKVLDFSSSNIKNLPEEIGQLTCLQLIDLHECDELETIHPGALSKLTRLEELNMKDTFIKWEVEEDKGERKNNPSLNELMGLCRLTALHLSISSAHIAPILDLFNGKVLERYDISVDYRNERWTADAWREHTLRTTKRLRLNLQCNRFLDFDLGVLLESCEEMELQDVEGINSLVPEADRKGFQQLRHLNCEGVEIQYIINSEQQNRVDCIGAFKLLETLNLASLARLERVCHGKLAPDSFTNLLDLKVCDCNNLRYLFSFSMAKHIRQLRNIEVISCERIKEVVVHDGEFSSNNGTTIFPELHTVRLEGLPGLLTFCSSELMSSQRVLPLFSEQDLAPCLRELVIKDCGSIKYLFSSTFAATLSLLNQVDLRSCTMMEEIIKPDEDMGLKFPILKYLRLHDLPKLIRFYTGPSLQFPELVEIELRKCPQLVTFVSSSLSTISFNNGTVMTTIFPKLHTVRLKGLPGLLTFCSSELMSSQRVLPLFSEQDLAPCLRELEIKDCGSIKYLFSSTFAATLSLLNQVNLRRCTMMEGIITPDKDMGLKFPILKYLRLHDLPKLIRFYTGPSLQFPELVEIELRKCPQLVTFVSSSLSTDNSELSKGDSYPMRLPLFTDEVVAPNLTDLGVYDCESLKSLFSLFFATKLAQLNQLCIFHCCEMEEIIMSMDEKIVDKIEFLQLKNLELYALPKLRRFCSGIFPVQLPSSFNSVTSTNNPKRSNNNTNSSLVTLFNDSVAFPSLEVMRIGRIEKLNAIWHKQEVGNSFFCQLKEVYLTNMVYVVIKNLMLRRPQNLRRLEMEECDISEEVSLPFLEVKESTDSHASLQNSQLQLIIRDCGLKMALSPLTISLWKNVKFLWVDSCDGPENLLTYEAAKCLRQLKAMIISGCKNLVEVVANGGHNTEGGVIIFSQLEFLLLQRLPRLRSFCSANSILRFPKLTHIGLKDCFMMTFSNQLTETPQIKKVTMKYGYASLDEEYIEHLKPEDFNSLNIYRREQILDRVSVDDLLDSEVNVNHTIEHLWELQTGMILRELFAEQEIELLLMGLKNAGQTSLTLAVITGGYREDIASWEGFNMKKVTEGNVTIKLWDRGLWRRQRCCAASAIVHVVDAADPNNLRTSRSELHRALMWPLWAGIPLLVLGNKIDKPGALSKQALTDAMALNSIDDREVCCFMISCKNSTNIDSVIDWSVKHSKPKS